MRWQWTCRSGDVLCRQFCMLQSSHAVPHTALHAPGYWLSGQWPLQGNNLQCAAHTAGKSAAGWSSDHHQADLQIYRSIGHPAPNLVCPYFGPGLSWHVSLQNAALCSKFATFCKYLAWKVWQWLDWSGKLRYQSCILRGNIRRN